LERGKKLLLASADEFNPLYFPEGKEYIKEFIKDIKEKNIESIHEKFPDSETLINLLLSHKILVPFSQKKRKEKPSLPSLKDKSQGASLYLLISQSCNLSCIYCLDGKSTYEKNGNLMMTEEVAFRAIEKTLQNIRAGGNLDIIFFGGEPLLNWPMTKKIIIRCEEYFKPRYKDINLHYHTTSNLFLIPEDLIEWAKKYKMTFLCDIDGPPEIHNLLRPGKDGKGSFDKTAENVKLLASAGLKVSLRATVTSHNQDYMTETAKIHRDLGGAGSAFVNLNPVNSDKLILPSEWNPDPKKYLKGLKEIIEKGIWDSKYVFPVNDYEKRLEFRCKMLTGCGAAYGKTATVTVRGDIFPCIYWVGIASLKIGNVFDEENYYTSPVLKKLIEKLHIDYVKGCRRCKWRYFCAGGCPVHKISIEENPLAGEETIKYANSINCIISRGLLDYLLWKKAEEAYKKASISEMNQCGKKLWKPEGGS